MKNTLILLILCLILCACGKTTEEVEIIPTEVITEAPTDTPEPTEEPIKVTSVNLGETISTDYIELTLTGYDYVDGNLYFSDWQSLDPINGMPFFYLTGTVKNIDCYDYELDYNTIIEMAFDDKYVYSNSSGVVTNDSVYGMVAPNQTTEVYIFVPVPLETINSFKKCVVRLQWGLEWEENEIYEITITR